MSTGKHENWRERMIRKLMTVVAVTVVAASAREARAQAVAVQATVPAPAAAAPAAPAEGGYRLPVSYTERGITNPEKILSPELDFDITRVPGLGAPPPGAAAVVANLAIGAGYSITNDLGVRATVIPIQFNPTVHYLGPNLGATYRFLKGDFELGVAGDVLIQTCGTGSLCVNPQSPTILPSDNAGVFFSPSLPMRLHIGKQAVLDAQPGLVVGGDGAGPQVGLRVPVSFAYDIVEPVVHAGVFTGFDMNFTTPKNLLGVTIGDQVSVPLGIFGGCAVPGKEGPIADIDAFFGWAALFNGGATTETGFYTFGVTGIYYLYL
jgi:hypothetical protein